MGKITTTTTTTTTSVVNVIFIICGYILFSSTSTNAFMTSSPPSSLSFENPRSLKPIALKPTTTTAVTARRATNHPILSVLSTSSRRNNGCELNMRNNNGNGDSISERALSCLPYLLPLLDGDEFGRYIYMRVPPLGMLDAIVLGPFQIIYNSIPFGQLILFFALTIAARNAEMFSSNVRFNMQQAVLLDIALIFPQLLGSVVGGNVPLPRVIIESSSNFVYYGLIVAVVYSVISNISGKKPNQIPWISEAAEMQTGSFF